MSNKVKSVWLGYAKSTVQNERVELQPDASNKKLNVEYNTIEFVISNYKEVATPQKISKGYGHLLNQVQSNKL